MEIDAILDRYPSSISGGQQQRASLARALVRQADLYLLDEPMGQLEPQLRAVLRGRLKSLLVERGMTSIFVTHDQTEANALADRIAVMEDGVLQQFASQKELNDRPANLFVATFVGEPPMNVFEATVVNGDRVRFAIDGRSDPRLRRRPRFRQSVRDAIGRRERVVIGVRPHAVRLGSGRAMTRASSPINGSATRAISRSTWRESCWSPSRMRRSRRRPARRLRFGVSASDLHVFDAHDRGAVPWSGGGMIAALSECARVCP